ncbi:MAG: hypothetical protein ACE5E7_14965 [Anaerolineae bacterium]
MIKKLTLILMLLVLAVACGPAGTPEATNEAAAVSEATSAEPTAPASTETAVPTETATAVPQPTAEQAVAPAEAAPEVAVGEAAVIREQDWVIGAAEPAVTIIEYGDFQ